MSNYITEKDYYTTYKGSTIPEKEFEKYATKASNEVRLRIMNKPVIGFESEIKNVTCSIADIIFNQEHKKKMLETFITGTNQVVTSEKVGDYSRNLSGISISDLRSECESTNKKIDDEINSALFFTGLLYSGIVNVR